MDVIEISFQYCFIEKYMCILIAIFIYYLVRRILNLYKTLSTCK